VEGYTGDKKTTVIIDTGPDFRQQALAANLTWADAVLYTHPHADHCHGIDDLRAFVINRRQRVQIYADAPMMQRLKEGFGYCFETPEGSMYPPILEANDISAGVPVVIEGEGGSISFLPFSQHHGPIISLGFRFGNIAYSSDISAIHEASHDALKDLDVWIVDALQYKPHISHFSLEEALEAISQFTPKKAYLTHMHTPLDYETVMKETPEHVQPAYDGLEFWA
jgi:phosphoribosyl 1,2-cyclic phosphate phosphodiesterase